ncbi:MAG TPA: hypothetical protein VGR35_03530 [Tepidisphaeraceae bacterium]|nr:hypothetical protein [Tepidisphaeraceae bacterium]
MIVTRTLLLTVALLAAALGLGCERNEEVQTYSAPKDPPAVKPVGFVVPDGWRELRAQQMQYAAFAVDPEHSDASLTIVPLPREANELAPNVNRWERQLGLEPSSPEAVNQMVTHIDVGDAHVDVVDLSGTDAVNGTGAPRRMLAAIVPHGTMTWFFTLKGPPQVVERQKPNFDAFIRSLKFRPTGDEPADDAGHAPAQLAMAAQPTKPTEDPHAGHDHGPGGHDDHAGHDHGPAQPAAEKIDWGALPPGWVEDPTPRPMRAHTLVVESDGKKGEVIVSRLPQNGVGSLLDNINRWRGQVGLEPVKEPTQKPRAMNIAGTEGFAFDFEGPAKEGQPARRQIVALTSQANMFWFVRFIGPKELVDAQQKAFEKLLADAHFAAPAGAAAATPATQPQQSAPSPSPSTEPSGSAR